MSKEDGLLLEIIEKTESRTIRWANISPGRYHDFIFQSNSAYQAFSAEYRKSGQNYTLVLVHKKVIGHNLDFDVVEEKHHTELLIISEGRLVYELNEFNVEIDLLSQLSNLVGDLNDDARFLFGDNLESE